MLNKNEPKIYKIALLMLAMAMLVCSWLGYAETSQIVEYSKYDGYLLKDMGKQGYYYRFSSLEKTLAEGHHHRQPFIERLAIGSGTYAFELPYGSNSWGVQFFDTREGLCSEEIWMGTIYAHYYIKEDYHAPNDTLLAYLEYISATEKDRFEESVLVIKTVFNDSVEVRIERDFVAYTTGLNALRFINENELYLSYNKYTGPERFDSTEVTEIIRFR